jgi:hypothetical protein
MPFAHRFAPFAFEGRRTRIVSPSGRLYIPASPFSLREGLVLRSNGSREHKTSPSSPRKSVAGEGGGPNIEG